MPREITRLNIPNSADHIVLYDWMEVPSGHNLVRLDESENILWEPDPPTIGIKDCFTSVRWDGSKLIAYSWSGFEMSVAIEDGKITVLRFTK